MSMTESEATAWLKYMKGRKLPYDRAENRRRLAYSVAISALEEVQKYRAIGTVEELRELKEKNTPKELTEHNFQDEVHHWLCPNCKSIVSSNQNYCEECGQALET